MKHTKQLTIFVLLLLCSTRMSAQQLAIGTDIALDALQTPNLSAEMVVGERSTISLSAFGNNDPWGKDISMLGVQPEFRYYLSGRPMHEIFVGVGGIGANYDITWKNKVYDGTAYGVGLTFGYVWNLTNRLNIDAHAGFGIIWYDHKEFFKNDNYADYTPNGSFEPNASGYYLLPTRIGISITYIFK